MKVISNEARSITIEGVAFTPDVKGVIIPEAKVAKMKENFFFKHYVKVGAFIIDEPKEDTKNTGKK